MNDCKDPVKPALFLMRSDLSETRYGFTLHRTDETSKKSCKAPLELIYIYIYIYIIIQFYIHINWWYTRDILMHWKPPETILTTPSGWHQEAATDGQDRRHRVEAPKKGPCWVKVKAWNQGQGGLPGDPQWPMYPLVSSNMAGKAPNWIKVSSQGNHW